MSKVVITNTTNAPVFVAGRLLTCGASIEAFESEVPDCLRSQIPTTANEAEASKEEGEGDDMTTDPANDDELAEDALIAAAGKKK